MKKVGIVLALVASIGFAKSGEEIYKSKCMACHTIDKMKKPMLAPPLAKVSARIKFVKKDKEKFIAFVKDYITNPAKEKSVCFKRVFKKFNVMPPIGKSMSDEEKTAVAEWMYGLDTTKFEKMFKSGMKCGNGKCGGAKKGMMKCGMGQCDDKKKKSMKCGNGKCGAVKIETH